MNNLIKFTLIIFALHASILSAKAQQWNGPDNTTSNIDRTGNVCIGGSSPEQLLTLSATSPVLRFERTGSGAWDYEMYATGGGQLRFRGGSNSTGSALKDYMTLKGGGQVLIGTTVSLPSTLGGINISGYRLFVAGGILTEEILVREGWADYVFEDSYKLLSLNEVEKHIETYGHLPNTPSAKEIEDGGLNLGELTVNQQEKIEELFLHVIEQAQNSQQSVVASFKSGNSEKQLVTNNSRALGKKRFQKISYYRYKRKHKQKIIPPPIRLPSSP